MAFGMACLVGVDLGYFDLASISRRVGLIVTGAAVLASWLVLLVVGRWNTDGS